MNRTIIILMGIFFGCNNQKSISTNETLAKPDSIATTSQVDNEFKDLVNSLPIINTPITFDSDDGISSKSFEIKDEKLLTRLRSRIPDLLGYAKVEDSKNYYLIIGISPSDIGSPILMTFDKAGNEIDSFFMFKTAGGDIGYYSRNTVTLNSASEFILIDSTTTRELNETGDDEIEGSDKLTVHTISYEILDNGKIHEVKE